MTTLLSLCVRCVPGAVPPSLHCAPFTSSAVCATAASKRLFPRRIILLRHGESQGNANELVYGTTPDWRVTLTTKGRLQSMGAGERLRHIVKNETVHVYVSPYVRAKQTLEGVLSVLTPEQVVCVQEEPRVSEQQFGNFQNLQEVQFQKAERRRFGRFFYRFPHGEAGIDVYGRVTGFLGTLYREHTRKRAQNLLIVTHGLCLRLFLMRWFRWSVSTFEFTHNPPNCGIVVMERGSDGKYVITQDAGILSSHRLAGTKVHGLPPEEGEEPPELGGLDGVDLDLAGESELDVNVDNLTPDTVSVPKRRPGRPKKNSK